MYNDDRQALWSYASLAQKAVVHMRTSAESLYVVADLLRESSEALTLLRHKFQAAELGVWRNPVGEKKR